MKKMFLFFAALCCTVMMQAETLNVSYLYPVYNTDGVATSGIKEWESTSVDATVVTNSTEVVTWGVAGTTTWYVVNDADVTFSKGAVCQGDVHLILADGAKLTATGNEDNYTPGIQVSGNGNSLTIHGQANQSGQLEANGGYLAAGIGGGYQRPGSNITINGGKVTAYGGNGSAGIGGGDGGSGSNITINGGTVTANGHGSAAGIGNGFGGSCNNIRVATTLLVKADNNNPPTTEIEHDGGGDIAGKLNGQRHATIVSILPFRDAAIAAIDAALDGNTNENIMYFVTPFKTDIEAATTAKAINSIKEKALTDLQKIIAIYDAGKNEMADAEDLVLPIDPTNHGDKLGEVAFQNASVVEDGIYHHWHCEACGNDYADADATESMNGKTTKARYEADALLIGNTTVDESYLLDGAKVTFDGDQVNLSIGSDKHVYDLSETERLAINFSHTFPLTANQDPNHTSDYYATFFTSEGAYKVPETAKAYIGEVKGDVGIDVLNLTPAPDGLIAACEAVVLRATQSNVLLMPSCSKANASTANMLQGSDEPMTLPQYSFALSFGQNGVGFYDFSGDELPANNAYLTLATHSNGLRFSFGDGTGTAIDTPVVDAPVRAYTLQGQQVDENYRGIVIVNGMKVLKR